MSERTEDKLRQMMMTKLMVFLVERAQIGSFGWDAWLAENGITTNPENTDDYFAVTMNITFSKESSWYGATVFHVPKELAMKALVLDFMP